MLKRLIKMITKYAMDIRIERIEKELNKKRNTYAQILKIQNEKARKLSKQLSEELQKTSKLTNEEYRRLANSIYMNQSRKAYSDFLRAVKLEQRRLKNKGIDFDAKQSKETSED